MSLSHMMCGTSILTVVHMSRIPVERVFRVLADDMRKALPKPIIDFTHETRPTVVTYSELEIMQLFFFKCQKNEEFASRLSLKRGASHHRTTQFSSMACASNSSWR